MIPRSSVSQILMGAPIGCPTLRCQSALSIGQNDSLSWGTTKTAPGLSCERRRNCKCLNPGWTEKNWSGREDLNLRPPGPETKEISQSVDFSIHVSGAPTVQTHVIPVRPSHSFSYGCPRMGAPRQGTSGRPASVLRSCRTKRLDYIGVARSLSRTSDRY